MFHVTDHYAAAKKNEARPNDMGSFPSHNYLVQVAKEKKHLCPLKYDDKLSKRPRRKFQ